MEYKYIIFVKKASGQVFIFKTTEFEVLGNRVLFRDLKSNEVLNFDSRNCDIKKERGLI